MGKQTKTFRQTNRSSSGDQGAKNYSQVNRAEGWGKIFSAFKLKRGEIK